MDIKSVYDVIKNNITAFYPTGSRYICNPPVMDTDEDYVVLPKSIVYKGILHNHLLELGFRVDGDPGSYDPDNDTFLSYKNLPLNLIVVINEDVFKQWVTATELAKKLNLLNKQDRIILFDYVFKKEF